MKKAKRLIAGLLLVLFLAAVASAAPEFWGSRRSDKYHYPSCRYAKQIKSENLIVFNTPEEAKDAGYVPCKVCKPPSRSGE